MRARKPIPTVRGQLSPWLETEAGGRWAVLLVALALYIATGAPTVLWGDDAAFQRHLHSFKIAFSPQAHPLWTVVARPFLYLPVGDVAYRANLVSAVFGAVTLLLVYIITGHLADGARSPRPHVVPSRLLVTAILGLSHTFWLHAVRAEVYTLNTFFFTAVWLALIKWNEEGKWPWLLLAAITWVMSLGNHLLMVTALPGYLLLAAQPALRHPRRRRIMISAAATTVCLGLLAIALPSTRHLIVNAWQEFWPPRLSVRDALLGIGFLGYNLMFSTPIAVLGLVRLWRQARVQASAIALFALFTGAFALTFDVPDVYVFYLPAYVALAVACAAGLSRMERQWSARTGGALVAILLVLPVVTYRVTPLIVNRLDAHLLPVRDLPGRDAETFFLWPPKTGYWGARAYGETALNSVPPNAVILADATPGKTMRYLQQVENLRTDVLVAERAFGRGLQAPFLVEQSADRPVYLADVQAYYDIAEIEQHFDIVPFGPIYELRPLKEGAETAPLRADE